MTFEAKRDYNNVYFMQVDIQGHSPMLRQNAADIADAALDGFEKLVYEAVDEASKKTSCELNEFWGWAGDGGLCVFYDSQQESKAKETVLKQHM